MSSFGSVVEQLRQRLDRQRFRRREDQGFDDGFQLRHTYSVLSVVDGGAWTSRDLVLPNTGAPSGRARL